MAKASAFRAGAARPQIVPASWSRVASAARGFPPGALLHDLACDRHPPGAEALTFAWEDGRVERLTFGDLARASEQLAQRFAAAGVGPGAGVAVVLPQCPLSPAVHLALSRLGAVSVPVSPLFGPDGLRPRLAASRPAMAVVHAARARALREAMPSLPVWVSEHGALEVPDELPPARRGPAILALASLEPAMSLVFTSGTTAEPKAALLPHRVVPGRVPGLQRVHPGFPQPGDRFWSPADWAWIGGLYDSLFAPWAAGVPVFAYERRGPFDAARAAELLREHGVRNAFLPPTALRLWMRSGVPAPELRTLHTAGEPLPGPVHAWAAKHFGLQPREVYGLTECAFVLVNEAGEPGVTGRPAPGQEVELLREGQRCPDGEPGEVCVREGSPTMMLGYLEGNQFQLPLDAQGWFHTGDLAVRDARGLTVLGRLDEVVKVSGHRVAPREVEELLLGHPAVEECCVVGVPDAVRGHALKAVVKPAAGHPPGEALAAQLQQWVRERGGAHLAPRSVEFVRELPTTATGKVRRGALREP